MSECECSYRGVACTHKDMSDHLPECFIVNPRLRDQGCICPELRACEERAVLEAVKSAGQAYDEGFSDALDRAVEAVKALYVPGWPPTNAEVLAAISGLRVEET